MDKETKIPERVWITLMPDGGLTHIALFEKYPDKQSVEFVPAALLEEARKEARAAFEASSAAEFDAFNIISQMVELLQEDSPQSAMELGMDALVKNAKRHHKAKFPAKADGEVTKEKI